jgi:polysaccharide pyruvyl transferase WcaK-like protein
MLYKISSAFITLDYLRWRLINLLSTSNTALYLGWLGHHNLGDEALYDCIKYLFKNSCSFFNAANIYRMPGFLKQNLQFDILFLGGGTLINRADDVIDSLKTMQQYSHRRIVFGTGVANDDFWNTISPRPNRNHDWKDFLDSCDFLGVRGPYSLASLNKMGISRARIVGDPVLQFSDNAVTPKKKRKAIGINIGNTNGVLWGGSDAALENLICSFSLSLLESGWHVSFVNVYDKDLAPLQRMIARQPWASRVAIHDFSNGGYERVRRFYRELDIFVGEKLHSSVFAACAYTPFISLEYRPKCKDFCASLNYERFNVRVDQVQIPMLMDLVAELYGNIQHWQKYIFDQVGHFIDLQRKLAADLYKLK